VFADEGKRGDGGRDSAGYGLSAAEGVASRWSANGDYFDAARTEQLDRFEKCSTCRQHKAGYRRARRVVERVGCEDAHVQLERDIGRVALQPRCRPIIADNENPRAAKLGSDIGETSRIARPRKRAFKFSAQPFIRRTQQYALSRLFVDDALPMPRKTSRQQCRPHTRFVALYPHRTPQYDLRAVMPPHKPSPNWIVIALGALLWATMTLIPLFRAAPASPPSPTAGQEASSLFSAAALILTCLPLACLLFGALRQERILYQFLFPLLLLATQFGPASTGWDDPIQYVPNGIAFALFFAAASFFGAAPVPVSPVRTVALHNNSAARQRLRHDALAFLPHAIAALSLATLLALAPAWDGALATALESSQADRALGPTSALIPFASVALAFAALALHAGRAFERARELSGYLHEDPITARNRWAPSRPRVAGTLLLLAAGVAIGLTLVWIR
jgi:hypothetical protein